jgi:hypothetical protein
MWNFSFRPQYSDDVDVRDIEIASWLAHSFISGPVEHFTIGHFAFYNNIGRTEVQPIPTDPEATGAGNSLSLRSFSISRAGRDSRVRVGSLT